MKKINYNINDFPFKLKLEKIFQIDELTNLNDNIEIFTREKDQSTNWHKLFYSWTRTDEFIKLYDKFILEIIF